MKCDGTTLWMAFLVHLGLTATPVAGRIESQVFLEANGLNFSCTQLLDSNDDNSQGFDVVNVVLLHGFPMNRDWYLPLLNFWNASENLSVNALACDLRGYSPGASPSDISSYAYENMASDAFELAHAAGYRDFHLIGHDHGAGVGWLAASMAETYDSNLTMLSYTAMSVPHPDVFSKALCSDAGQEDEAQIIASNYFNQFSLPDSASINNGSLTDLFASFGLPVDPTTFQPPLWWYNGSMPTYIALPRSLNSTEESDDLVTLVRQAIPMDARPCLPQEQSIGPVVIPTLFVCGGADPYLLCTRPSSVPDETLVPEYQNYTAPTCGHDFFQDIDCQDPQDSLNTMYAISDFLFGTDYLRGDESTPTGAWAPTTAPTSTTSTTTTTTTTTSQDSSSSSSTILSRLGTIGGMVLVTSIWMVVGWW
jgi:pimeloyl-ACP methyl ester carboxylesterase